MDPNATMVEIRALLLSAQRAEDADRDPRPEDASRLVELVSALDVWLSNGGFLPRAWERSK